MKKKYLNKEDFKNYINICPKVSLICSTKKNKRITNELIKDKQISCFFDLSLIKENNSIIDLNKDYINSRIVDGIKIGNLAKEFFKKDNKWKTLENFKSDEALKLTKKYINDKNIKVFFESYFKYNNCVIRCDILKRVSNNKFDLIEVKASNNLKKEHFLDVLFQYYVLVNSGIEINNVKLMYLNKDYVFLDTLDLNEFFIITDECKLGRRTIFLSDFINIEYLQKKDKFEKKIETIKSYILKNENDFYKELTKKYCNDYNKKLEYCYHVIKKIPNKDTIFNLYKLLKTKKIKFLYDENILFLKDINLSHNYFHKFSDIQKRQINVVIGHDSEIDKSKKEYILNLLKEYKYPIYMYDFETFQLAKPLFDYSSPYQQIPFQYSIHILENENFNYLTNKNISHFFFLEDGENDPRINLIKKMIEDFFKFGNGVYVAYNKVFEKNIIKNLIHFVELNSNKKSLFINPKEIIQKLKFIFNHTIDLMDFFNGFIIYKKDFNGSLSIKKTLPAFDKTFDYNHLKVQKGDQASSLFKNRIENNILLSDWLKKYKNDMIKYCNQDTLGMVVLFKKINEYIRQ